MFVLRLYDKAKFFVNLEILEQTPGVPWKPNKGCETVFVDESVTSLTQCQADEIRKIIYKVFEQSSSKYSSHICTMTHPHKQNYKRVLKQPHYKVKLVDLLLDILINKDNIEEYSCIKAD